MISLLVYKAITIMNNILKYKRMVFLAIRLLLFEGFDINFCELPIFRTV